MIFNKYIPPVNPETDNSATTLSEFPDWLFNTTY